LVSFCCLGSLIDFVIIWTLLPKFDRLIFLCLCFAMLRIRDILVWIRIRVCRSVHVTNGSRSDSGSGSCY
jgi:hypothetical protein